jgi:hypothetical protein
MFLNLLFLLLLNLLVSDPEPEGVLAKQNLNPGLIQRTELERLENELNQQPKPNQQSELERVLENLSVDCSHWDGGCSFGYPTTRW